MEIEIVIVYQDRYRGGHEKAFVPPLTGAHLAGLIGDRARVSLRHEKLRPLDVGAPPAAKILFLSTGTGFASRAYWLGDHLRALGKTVVIGGPHATLWPREAARHADAVVKGEAEDVIDTLLSDLSRGSLRPLYEGRARALNGLPTPRYELIEEAYFVGRVVMATRGCPFSCAFCSTPRLSPGWRTRPIDEVLRDIEAYRGRSWAQRKVIWFWDDNLTADRGYAKALLRELAPLKKRWVTQASIDCARDPELLRLMADSGCMGVFLGIETTSRTSLREIRKGHNDPLHYRAAIEKLHAHGIAVMAGMMVGFDQETAEDVVAVADYLQAIGVDVPFLSVLTPFGGTALRDKLERERRLLKERGWQYYNGFNVTYRPRRMSPEELERAHRALWQRAYSPWRTFTRVLTNTRQLGLRGLPLSALMNGYYGLKNLRGTGPVTPAGSSGLGG